MRLDPPLNPARPPVSGGRAQHDFGNDDDDDSLGSRQATAESSVRRIATRWRWSRYGLGAWPQRKNVMAATVCRSFSLGERARIYVERRKT